MQASFRIVLTSKLLLLFHVNFLFVCLLLWGGEGGEKTQDMAVVEKTFCNFLFELLKFYIDYVLNFTGYDLYISYKIHCIIHALLRKSECD